jgi:Protein of unknown function (DUF1592)/Protein of unknown function (DUF1588)/Protein of unknown function (DUF1595)/Protein of unknown function (DUF1587)/Protein of unknown function (DUF1585)
MAFTTRVGLASALALSLLALACSSETSGPGSGMPNNMGNAGSTGVGGGSTIPPVLTEESCKGAIVPGRTPLRRLTGTEYNNTVAALLEDTTAPANKFPPPEESSGFLNNGDAYQTTELHVQSWFSAAETLAAAYRKAGKLTLPCAGDAQNCATQFIKDFGKKVFRRPLLDDEVASYLKRFVAGSTGSTFDEGLEWVVGRMLQSPYFLYRVELESQGTPAGTVVPLSDYSVATRLSYFLWSSTPDADLLAAADAHQLSTPEGVAAQTTRMMASPGFDSTITSFHEQWSDWADVYGAAKTASTTPAWDANMQADMIHESELFVKSIFDDKGSFKDLLTANYTFVNPPLAQFYGIAYPGTGSDFVRVDNVPHRYGFLTSPSILAGHAHPNQSAPVKRGYMIRKHLLCTDPPPPPPGLVINVPTPVAGQTTKERFTAHRTDASCNACHVLLDPLGLTLENYDEFGRWRDMDGGKPVDASGGLTMVPSLGGVIDPTLAPLSGPQDLGEKLAGLKEAQECMVFSWFRYAMGHQEEAADTCTVKTLLTRFNGSQQNLNDLLVGIATSDGFRYRVDLAQ